MAVLSHFWIMFLSFFLISSLTFAHIFGLFKALSRNECFVGILNNAEEIVSNYSCLTLLQS